jgi:hypothetical protein
MSDDDYVPVVDAARSPLLAEIGRLRSELYNVHAHLQHMREETARLREALQQIGYASDDSAIERAPSTWIKSARHIARRALEEGK